jgi:hypothetical protein
VIVAPTTIVWPSLIILRVIEKESSWQVGGFDGLHSTFGLCRTSKAAILLLIALLVGEESGLKRQIWPDTESEHLKSEVPD